ALPEEFRGGWGGTGVVARAAPPAGRVGARGGRAAARTAPPPRASERSRRGRGGWRLRASSADADQPSRHTSENASAVESSGAGRALFGFGVRFRDFGPR